MKEIACEIGAFGKIRIMERIADGARLYCIGDSVQTMIAQDGVSLLGTYKTRVPLGDPVDKPLEGACLIE
jgi:hypothetical protein